MSSPSRPVAITCGEPAGIGPEIAARAWAALSSDIPMFWIGDPRHLPTDVPHRLIDSADDVGAPSTDALPVLPHAFDSAALAGVPQPGHAQG